MIADGLCETFIAVYPTLYELFLSMLNARSLPRGVDPEG